VVFNAAEGWARDVSEDIADNLAQACANEDEDTPDALEDFVERHGSGKCLYCRCRLKVLPVRQPSSSKPSHSMMPVSNSLAHRR
jgi:hypothetical protein